MAIQDAFTFTHDGRTRTVDVLKISFTTASYEPEVGMNLAALTWLDGGGELDEQRVRMKNASFSQAELVAAFQAQLSDMSITMTNSQVGQLITGAAEKAVRARWED